MTSERKKAILTLVGTLVIGILLGMLLPGLFHKMRDRGMRGRDFKKPETEHKREWFTGTIYHIIQPDSAQTIQIKPVTTWAATEIDSVDASANQAMAKILDSVKVQLKPILTEEQFKRLDEFDTRAQKHWKGRGRH